MTITPEMLARSGSEDGEQAALFCWAAMNFEIYPQLKWMHAIPNDGHHRRVAQGVRSGVSDIFLPYPTVFNHGLYLELKTIKRKKEKNGGLSDDQITFLIYANSVSYRATVAYGWEEGKREILKYLNGE